ncbi:MAG: hypothetical protein EWM47_05650 [Anaerolineaceae bacterium]|nr:MAG: hypothetical protein EWM47_05650 [Anaerolineaceae bacterium]
MEEKDLNMTIKMGAKSFAGIKDLDEGRPIDEKQIEDLCQFADARFDCADFRVLILIKTIYAYSDCLTADTKARIKKTLLDFKYWMDEPGDDSMCFWSENHQLIFHTCEYLAGLLYPGEIFTNSHMTGKEHVEKAKKKLLLWLENKWTYGFIEWHSNTYYEEDIAPLALLVDYALEEEIGIKSQIILDLLLLELAMYSYDGFFSVTSGRCYEAQKKDGNRQDTRDIYRYAFDSSSDDFDYTRISSAFILSKKYKVPKVIKAIASDQNPKVMKDSMGLNLQELKHEMDIKDIDRGGAYLWQMEAFTNVESIETTIDMFNHYKMYQNVFLKDLKMINSKLLRKLRLLPLLVRVLNPSTQGVAIQRSNSYTYKTKDFMLSTSMRYHPGEFGDQQHIWHAVLPNNIHVFATHPGAPFFDDNARNFSPSYWVGNGILPDAVQHENVHMSIYKCDQRKGFLERSRPQMSHVYFPKSHFNEVVIKEKAVFGRSGETYIALLGVHPLEYNNEDEIIQRGAVTAWICELSSKDEAGSFEEFITQIMTAQVTFAGNILTYKNQALTYKKAYQVDGVLVNAEYDRFDTPYVKAKRKADQLNIAHNGLKLHLDFNRLKREEH